MQLFNDKNENYGFRHKKQNDFEIQNNLYNAVCHQYFIENYGPKKAEMFNETVLLF